MALSGLRAALMGGASISGVDAPASAGGLVERIGAGLKEALEGEFLYSKNDEQTQALVREQLRGFLRHLESTGRVQPRQVVPLVSQGDDPNAISVAFVSGYAKVVVDSLEENDGLSEALVAHRLGELAAREVLVESFSSAALRGLGEPTGRCLVSPFDEATDTFAVSMSHWGVGYEIDVRHEGDQMVISPRPLTAEQLVALGFPSGAF